MPVELILTDHPIRAVEALARDLRDHRPTDPFEPQVVWLTDPGLAGWVKTWIAHHVGIAANLDLIELRAGLLRAWDDATGQPLEAPTAADLAGDVLGVWHAQTDPRLGALATMLDKGLAEDRAAREAALAMQVGEWLSRRFWNGCASDASKDPAPLEPWLAATLAAVSDPRATVQRHPPRRPLTNRIRVLASRALTAPEWALLERLDAASSAAIQVVHAVIDPQRWRQGGRFQDGSAAERLLAAEVEAARPSAHIAVRTWTDSDWREPHTPPPALARIHRALRHPDTPAPAGPPASGPELFMPAWSPRREVEQVRDRLLTRFSKGAAVDGTRLEPRDVLILTPDMATYGPLIANIFGAEPCLADPVDAGDRPTTAARCPAIPTALAGLGLSQLNPVAKALLHVLTIAADRVTAPMVFQLATTPVVQSAFGIPTDAAHALDTVLRESHAAWGFDAVDKEAVYGTPRPGISLHPNSLAFSSQRLALSAFMHDEADAGTTTIQTGAGPLRPLSLASRDRTHLAGAVDRLIGMLRSTSAALRTMDTATATQWNQQLKALVQRFTRTGPTTAFLTRTVETVIDEIISARDDVQLGLEGVRRLLRSRFELPVSAKGDYGGVVRVMPLRAGPTPVRSVVIFVGMGSGAWPRPPRRPEWWPPALGPSPVEIQRKAFADAILSAGREVWLSYCARELSKGQEQPPSALVQELEDLLGPDDATRAAWRTPRGRQAWSTTAPGTFAREVHDARLAVQQRSADTGAADAALGPLAALGRPDDGTVRQVKATTLVATLLNPSKTFLYQRLGVYLPEVEEALSEREPLGASGLDKYQLKVQAFDWLQTHGVDPTDPAAVTRGVTALIDMQRGTGTLSLGRVPTVETAECVQIAADTLAALQSLDGRLQRDARYSIHLAHDGDAQDLSITIPCVRIRSGPSGPRHLHVWPKLGKSLHRPRLLAWLGVWIARALAQPVDGALLISEGPAEWLLPVVDSGPQPPLEPMTVLRELWTLAEAASRSPLHLFKNSSMELVGRLCSSRAPKDEQKLRASVKKGVETKWFDSLFNWDPDELDRWIAALHPTLNPAELAEQSVHLRRPFDQLPGPLDADADVASLSRQLWERLLRSRRPPAGHQKLTVDGHPLRHWTTP